MLLLLAAVQVKAQCPPNMAHYFPLDEKTAGTYKDKMGGPDATCTNCPAPATGLFAGAQRFDGSNDGIVLQDKTVFEWGSNASFTIEFWVQTTASSGSNQVIMGRTATDTDMTWWIGLDKSGSAVFSFFDNQNKGTVIGNGESKLNDGKWHHIVVVRDGINERNKIYVDGYTTANFKQVYTGTFESISQVTLGYLDKHAGTNYNGLLDEVMVYQRNLSEVEVRARYNNGAGSYCGTEQVAPTLMSEPVTYGVVGQQYLYQVQATGNPRPAFTLVSPPAGMSINASTGEIKWVPAATGKFPVKVQAKNSAGQAEQNYTITVKDSIGEKFGMVHHWMLNEVSGLTFKDFYTPADATAEAEAKPTPTTGVVGGGQHFNGQSSGLDVIKSSNFNWDPNENFTIELWMRSSASTAGGRVFIGRSASDSPTHWWLGANGNGNAAFQLLDIEYQGHLIGNTGPKLNDGIWHQVVVVREGSAGATRLYVDGEQIATGNYSFQHNFASKTPVNIGYLKSGNGYRYEGDLDEVKLFHRALSPQEIKERYTDTFDAITDLLLFEGEFINNTVVLKWETINETNLKTFEIERSANGTEFTKIGEVAGSGTSSERLAYTYTDEKPLDGRAYYRLRIVKESGAHTYSNTIIIDNRSITASEFRVYPNPTNGQDVTVEVNRLVPDEPIELIVSDMTGRKLMQQSLNADAEGYLILNIQTLDKLTQGMYNITIATNKKVISRKLVVAR
ncbi:T9SS type A sorting domain-containing protein [Pontibacter sp. BT213]|uniref:T9SS type A sorting domain-containing protein n=2 Tax=Pontibacter fetidus TaxID=2700082 RepID=A0A6B2H9C3_9BACT|nr:T9SS type A sorting domain-containing protein [Pontibacter fetidus]